MGLLDGKAALILGAGTRNNIGQSIAAKFASEGAAVMVSGRDILELSRLSTLIGAEFQYCDITSENDLALLIAETQKKLGGLDIAVNATGLNQTKPFLDVTRAELEQVVDVQLIGTFLFMQAVLRGISTNGSIIQISSVSASALLPNHAAYMASKAAADVLVRSIASEFGYRGIRVNGIAPGPTEDTPMAAQALADDRVKERIRSAIPMGRLGNSADIAEAALWLASDRSFITGEILQINGGRAIHRLG